MSKHHGAYRRFMTPLKSWERANVASPINVGGLFDRRVIGGGLLSRRVTDWRANDCIPTDLGHSADLSRID